MTDASKNTGPQPTVEQLLQQLQERAKELNCLYRVDEALSLPNASYEEMATGILEAIPPGWQYSDVCVARVAIFDKVYSSPEFAETEWRQNADVNAGDITVGSITVCYTTEKPSWDTGPFLKEEAKLIRTIADRLGNKVMHQQMRSIVESWNQVKDESANGDQAHWQVVLRMLAQTDRNLFLAVCRKMLNHLCWSGSTQAEALMSSFSPPPRDIEADMLGDQNQPYQRYVMAFSAELSDDIFKIAAENLSSETILQLIQRWIQEDKLSFLVQVVNRNLPLSSVADAIRRYHYLAENEPEVQSPNRRGIGVSLIRRFLSDQLPYINVAKHYVEINDFYELLNNVIFSAESQGKLGGKSAGMYLASQVLKKEVAKSALFEPVKTPKTYYITSDVLLHFMHYNNFSEIVEQKYKPINQARFEYPHIVQTFKSGRFPADIINGLSVALDDFGIQPLIVRSSSLLEDRIGASFSGKYKSLFLANQGTKNERLSALCDAIAEVYASTFGPDPIEYRSERGLLDFGEEMGVMIQGVVGNRIGDYFLPSFAGVAFSRNEFRWSHRIRRSDGLVRMVPGLGTRAVDRLADDYPVLVAPGQPNLRVNTTPGEVARYSPHNMDVINLASNVFETVSVRDFLRAGGDKLPGIELMVSLYRDQDLQPVSPTTDLTVEADDAVITFDGLMRRTPFLKQAGFILETLENALGMPVDIEFAHDGTDFYLLQCRSLCHSEHSAPAAMPKRIKPSKLLFSARKYVPNGHIPDITHIVYVDGVSYGKLPDKATMLKVGRAVGKLNKVLPRRQFILMGPGRWGSRGDIRLGVSVTYSDINNTAVLIEIARQQGNYLPDLSFGTHFFQDLVEAGIRYLPLYPDEPDMVLNESFLLGSDNLLAQLVPEFADLSDTVRVIDVAAATGGEILQLYMNADLDEAVALLTAPEA